MRIIKYSDPDFRSSLEAVVNRASLDLLANDGVVREILGQVEQNGDVALQEYTKRFDRHALPLDKIKVTRDEIDDALNHHLSVNVFNPNLTVLTVK